MREDKKMKIRKANKKDFEEFYQMRVDWYNEDKLKVPSRKEIKKEFDKNISSKDNLLLFAEDKEILGFLHGTITKNLWVKRGRIEDVYIKKKFRGKGIGTEIINYFIDWLKLRKFDKVNLMVQADNKRAFKLYSKMGFKLIQHYLSKKLK